MSSRWRSDVLKRGQLAERLVPIIRSHASGAVLSIEGDFGSGKTFFLTDFKGFLEEQGLACVYFNAWESDFMENPMLVLMGEIISTLHSLAPQTASAVKMKDAAKRLLPLLARIGLKSVLRAGGDELDKLLGPLDEEIDDLFDGKNDRKLSRRELAEARAALSDLIGEARAKSPGAFPLTVLVDELDRANPHWVVTFLESVKHLLGHEGIVFLIAIDRTNLEELLRHQFGSNYRVEDYLSKFFNYSLAVQNGSGDHQFLLQRLTAANLVADGFLTLDDSLATGASATANACLLALGGASGNFRRLERCTERISLCLRASGPTRWAALVGFLVGLERANPPLFNSFIGGLQAKKRMIEFANLKCREEDDWLLSWMLACTMKRGDWEGVRRNQVVVALGEDTAEQLDAVFRSREFFSLGSYQSAVDVTLEHVGWVFGQRR